MLATNRGQALVPSVSQLIYRATDGPQLHKCAPCAREGRTKTENRSSIIRHKTCTCKNHPMLLYETSQGPSDCGGGVKTGSPGCCTGTASLLNQHTLERGPCARRTTAVRSSTKMRRVLDRESGRQRELTHHVLTPHVSVEQVSF